MIIYHYQDGVCVFVIYHYQNSVNGVLIESMLARFLQISLPPKILYHRKKVTRGAAPYCLLQVTVRWGN